MRFPYALSLSLLAAACGDNIKPDTTTDGRPPVQCQPNQVVCDGDDLVTCDATGKEGSREPCELGCDSSAEPDRCVVPGVSNVDTGGGGGGGGDGPVCATPGTSDLTIASGQTMAIDTTDANCDLVVTQGTNEPKICVKKFKTVTVAATATLNATGPNALAIVATDAMTIDGIVDASATMTAGGPGASASGPGAGAAPTAASAGGGGGGFLTAGGTGGISSLLINQMGGVAGTMHGTPELIPNHAGGTGGNGGPQSPVGAGGFAGGALQLASCTSISIGAMAIIDAGGGGGGGGNGSINQATDPGGGGGGGGGGSILIEAPMVTVAGGVFANGGGGGSGGAHGTGGSPGQDGNRGADGTRSLTPAQGGPGVIIGEIVTGKGGNGGARDMAPEPGSQPTAAIVESSGGGGGAAGRIRFNVKAGTTPDVTGSMISPAPTEGSMAQN